MSNILYLLSILHNILLRIPKEYDRNYVLKLMSDYFRKLGDRFILFNETATNEIGNVIYSLKTHQSKYGGSVLDNVYE